MKTIYATKHDIIKWKQYHHRQRVVSRSKAFTFGTTEQLSQ